MKKVLKFALKYYLKFITKLVLAIHKPKIIVIAGSTNKTFVKNSIIAALKEKNLNFRSNPKSFNTEIGLPLAILSLPSGYNSYKKWLPAIYLSFTALFKKDFPKILVLEFGVDAPGDMKFLLSIIKPDLAIFTDITQRYLESFSAMDELVGEYELLAKKITAGGIIILNYDNLRLRRISAAAKAKVIFYGLQKPADNHYDYWQAVEVNKTANGQAVKLIHKNDFYDLKVDRFGLHHVYSLLASTIIKKIIEEKTI